jgi:hypothetical protein
MNILQCARYRRQRLKGIMKFVNVSLGAVTAGLTPLEVKEE